VTIAINTDRALRVDILNDGVSTVSAPAPSVAGTSLVRSLAGVLEDFIVTVLAAWLFPLGILFIGSPIALCVLVALELARRL
jgi:predicted membrane protein